MAGHLLLVVLMYNFSEMKAQVLLPPELTVNPLVITDTDLVTLHCQPPPSVSVSQCYFLIVRGGPASRFSCLQTLTGTELLKMSNQSSPAEVEVKCFYLKVSQSPESETSSITIRTSLPPKLTVNPPVINETDSVTLICQTPPSFTVTQCHFYISTGGTVRDSSCLQTLTGTELLKMSHQSSPGQTPQMSLQLFHGEHVLFTCSLPGSANHDTRCNLYFGEASDPVKTTTIWKKRTSTNQWFCQFIVTIDDLLKHLSLVKQSDASCDYSLGSEPNSLSPRSDRYSLTDIVEKESHMTQTVPTFIMTTGTRSHASTPVTSEKQTSGWTVGTLSITDSLISTFPTSVKPASGLSVSTSGTIDSSFSAVPQKTASDKKWILKFVVFVSGCGVTVGLIVLGLALICTKRTGSKEVKSQEPQYDNNDPYHLYNIISEEPAESALKNVMYSTVQIH